MSGDWPHKKDSGERKPSVEWLKEILGDSYTEEIDKKVSAEIGKAFVAKVDFDTKNTENKTLKGQLAEQTRRSRPSRAWISKRCAGKLPTGSGESQPATKDAAAQVEAVRFDAQLDSAIGKVKGRNTKAIKALLDVDALRASKDPDKDISAALEQLAKDSDYLFDTGNPPHPMPVALAAVLPVVVIRMLRCAQRLVCRRSKASNSNFEEMR